MFAVSIVNRERVVWEDERAALRESGHSIGVN